MFRPPSLLAPQIVPTAANTPAGQPGLLRPSRTRFVTSPRIGYANRPMTGNWRYGDLHPARLRPCRLLHSPKPILGKAEFDALHLEQPAVLFDGSVLRLELLMAAASQRGLRPRPAQVSAGFSAFRYLGAQRSSRCDSTSIVSCHAERRRRALLQIHGGTLK